MFDKSSVHLENKIDEYKMQHGRMYTKYYIRSFGRETSIRSETVQSGDVKQAQA